MMNRDQSIPLLITDRYLQKCNEDEIIPKEFNEELILMETNMLVV